MKTRDALRALAAITESQWGLVTSAQAQAAGLLHMDLTRLARSGDLVRVGHGVYRDAGAPTDQHEELRVAWLSTDPTRPAYQRLRDPHQDAVVSGESAAKLHGIGDFRADQVEISLPQRRRSRREGVRFRVREIEPQDTTLVQGLPVTSLERTIADLVRDGHDLGHVADAVSDALRQSQLDDRHLEELLRPAAHSRGFAQGDGQSLLRKLKEMSGRSEDPMVGLLSAASPLMTQILETTARAIAQNPDFARAILRESRLTELPASARNVIPPQALDLPDTAVKQLMDSTAQALKAFDSQRTVDATQLLLTLQKSRLGQNPASSPGDKEAESA